MEGLSEFPGRSGGTGERVGVRREGETTEGVGREGREGGGGFRRGREGGA